MLHHRILFKIIFTVTLLQIQTISTVTNLAGIAKLSNIFTAVVPSVDVVTAELAELVVTVLLKYLPSGENINRKPSTPSRSNPK